MPLQHTPDLQVRDTKEGRGVFANKDFKKGDALLPFTGPLLTFEEFSPSDTEFEDHSLQIGKDLYIGPSGGIDDLVNHSCDPNTGLVIEGSDVRLVAIKDIKTGEEVVWDYSTTMAEDKWEMDCACGSSVCRKKIRDFKHLRKDLQQKYIKLGIVPQFIVESL